MLHYYLKPKICKIENFHPAALKHENAYALLNFCIMYSVYSNCLLRLRLCYHIFSTTCINLTALLKGLAPV
jgi:hypothetical protein